MVDDDICVYPPRYHIWHILMYWKMDICQKKRNAINQYKLLELVFKVWYTQSTFLYFFRSCTDIPCCILFVAYIVGMVIVGIIGKVLLIAISYWRVGLIKLIVLVAEVNVCY